MPRILLVDDDASLREVLTFALRDRGHAVETAPDGRAALTVLESFRPEIVITDLKMPGLDGLEVLKRVLEVDSSIPVILLTAFGSIEDAVEAMRRGAYSYLTKPYNREELLVTVDQAFERRRLLLENRTLRDRLREQTRQIEFVHASPAMDQVVRMIRRIAPTDATVLVTGESGSGKEVVAHALHVWSDRWDRPMLAVNCGAIPRELMESELFGYVRGAFTGAFKDKPGKFQKADGGTLFLDEVGDLAPELQTKLLRVIESGQVDVVGGSQPVKVDVRLIAATNSDLGTRVQDGSFRQDLYYRLNVIPIVVPPLRERPDDIPALWDHFVKRYAGTETVRSSLALIRALMRRRWPGNVRELANLAQRMVLLRSSDSLGEDDLPPDPEEAARRPAGPSSPGGHAAPAMPPSPGDIEVPAGPSSPGALEVVAAPSSAGGGGSAAGLPANGEAWADPAAGFLGDLPPDRLPLWELEREIIVRALARHGGNRTRTADYLGIPRHVLLYRLEKFGIS